MTSVVLSQVEKQVKGKNMIVLGYTGYEVRWVGENLTVRFTRNVCVLCHETIGVDPNGWAGGHNAEPVAKGKCCADCSDRIVAVARLVEQGFTKEIAMGIVARQRYDGQVGI